jgi:hypothetical protein
MLEQMIRHILTDHSLNSYASRLSGPNAKDCISELCATLCEKDNDYLKKIEPYFNFWCVRTIRNMNGTRGCMAKYRSEDVDRDELLMSMFADHNETNLQKIKDALDSMYWYDRELFLTYIEEGSIRKVTKLTGIPVMSVHNTTKAVKDKIKWAVK